MTTTPSPAPFGVYGAAFSALRSVEKDAYDSIDAMADWMRETVGSTISMISSDEPLRGRITESDDPYLEAEDILLKILNAAMDTAIIEAIRQF